MCHAQRLASQSQEKSTGIEHHHKTNFLLMPLLLLPPLPLCSRHARVEHHHYMWCRLH
jgi:hypothetical protein